MINTTERTPTVIANTPCCVCGSSDSSEFFTRRYEKFNYAGNFHMRQCRGCGLLFCSPRLNDAGIAALYDANYYVFQKEDSAYFARTAEIFQRTVARLPGVVDKRVAEIGSGKGYLLAVLRELGWDVQGIEISPDAARYGRETFSVPCHAGTLEDYLAMDDRRSFPVVLCIDIIEHVLDPRQFVKGIARLTGPGGHVVIDTPNGRARHIDLEQENWRGFNPFHIYCFSSDNLPRLLEEEGFEVSEVFTYNNTVERAAKKPSVGDRLRTVLGAATPVAPAPSTLEECVAACRRSGSWNDTPDARAELADGCRGENLVVIATRKRSR